MTPRRGQAFAILETEVRLRDHTATGPLQFEVVTPTWNLPFEVSFYPENPPTIVPLADDGEVITNAGVGSLAAFLTMHGLHVTFEDELVLVEQGFLLKPERARLLYPREDIETPDWTGVNLRRESQGAARDPATIQYRTIELLAAETNWDVIVDDDGNGELADVVCLRRLDDKLHVALAHCKYSAEATAGARIDDLYDVCGQAMKMNRAKSIPEQLVKRLLRREQRRQMNGNSGMIKGDVATLGALVNEARYRELKTTIMVVQPGMSAAGASEDMLALLGATDRFLTETFFHVTFRVLAST